jgi:hypothetical protein
MKQVKNFYAEAKALDAMLDKVLAYKPKKGKKRARKRKGKG